MKPWYKTLSFYLPLIIIIPFIIIAFYNHPALDDWWYGEVYKQFGLGGAQEYWYTKYTARYFSNFVMTIAPLSYGWIEGYKLLPVVFIVLLYCTLWYISKVFFPADLSKKVTLPLWMTATYLLIQRDYFECLYWLSANVVYQYTMLYWMLHVTLVYQLFVQRQYSKTKAIAAIALSIAVIGSNETLGGLILVEAFLLIFISIKQKMLKTFAVFLLIAVLASWAVMFIARGNWTKIEGATLEHIYTFHFALAVKYSFISVGYYSVYLLKQPSVWCLIILSIPLWKFIVTQKLSLNKGVYMVLFSALCIAIAFTIYFISIYPTGILIPPLRVTNIAIVFLFSAIALLITWATERWNPIKNVIHNANEHRVVIMTACIVFAIALPTKFQQVITDLATGKAKAYNDAMFNRYSIIRAHASLDTIYLNKLANVPRTIVATDVSGPVSENIALIFGKANKVSIR